MTENLKLLISEEEIANKILELGIAIDQDYTDKSLTVIGILKGSFIFLADLVRSLTIPLETIEFLQLSSYGEKTISSGEVSILLNIDSEFITNQHILVVEDIVDTGISLNTTLNLLQQYNPNSLRLCTLLDKPSRRQRIVNIDYCGFQIPDYFVVGYGLDHNQKYRQLPAIYYQ
ncbi:MAG: hypoxanthine phosphoribosyltransferase [Microcystaceae cyanobacterium]